MADEDIKILPSVRQVLHHKLAQFCMESNGSDIYHFLEVVEILRTIVGNEPLKEHYKENYPKLNQHLKSLSYKLNKLKIYYDSIPQDDEALKEKKINELLKKSEIPMINKHLFKCFHLLLEKTELKYMPLPREYFKTVEKATKIIQPMENENR